MKKTTFKRYFFSALAAFILAQFSCLNVLAAGELDTTFNGTGKLVLQPGGFPIINDIAIQPDNKIVAAGYVAGAFLDFMIIRVNSDGTLDTGFGGDGIVTLPIGIYNDFGNAVALQPDGKIVIAGYRESELAYDFTLVRLNPDGSLDATFGQDGIVITNILTESYAFDLAIQYDGKIVVVGSTYVQDPDFVAARYLENGQLDTDFQGGVVIIPVLPGQDDRAQSVAVQNDGKIVIGGFSGIWYPLSQKTGRQMLVDSSFALVRLDPDGKPDETFGVGGKVISSVTNYSDKVNDVAIKEDGRIIALGQGYQTGSEACVTCLGMAQYGPTGILDPSFDLDGVLLNRNTGIGQKIAIQPDGKLLSSATRLGDFAVARNLADGTADSAIGMNGVATVDLGGNDAGKAIALQADGKIVLAGPSQTGAPPQVVRSIGIVRLAGDSPIPATANINGRVAGQSGAGLPNSQVEIVNLQTGEIKIISANPFGYFRLGGLATNNFYRVTAKNKRQKFGGPKTLRLLGNVNGLRFASK